MKASLLAVSAVVLCVFAVADPCRGAFYGYFDEVAGVPMDPLHTDWPRIDWLLVPSDTDGTPQGTAPARDGGLRGYQHRHHLR